VRVTEPAWWRAQLRRRNAATEPSAAHPRSRKTFAWVRHVFRGRSLCCVAIPPRHAMGVVVVRARASTSASIFFFPLFPLDLDRATRISSC